MSRDPDARWEAFIMAMLAAAVRRDPSRRDWIELHLDSPADLDRLGPLVAVAMAANA